MKINEENIKQFWDTRAKTHKINTNLTNLEEDNKLQELKLRLEEEKIDKYIPVLKGKKVLDLGGGWGYWGMKFAKTAEKVTVIDYCKKLIDEGRRIAKKDNINNISFICCNATKMPVKTKYDVIFISGLMIYLDNQSFIAVLQRLFLVSHPGTILVLRDGTALKKEFIVDKYSEELKTHYNAIYRTRAVYKKAFKLFWFKSCNDEDMFKDSKLNKRKETRLRIYKFIKR